LPRGAPRFRMTFEGVGETSGLADALSIFGISVVVCLCV
jgi:hypothetical protein